MIDLNRTMLPGTNSFKHMFKNIKLNHSITTAMIRCGTCNIESIEDCENTPLDGIRVIF